MSRIIEEIAHRMLQELAGAEEEACEKALQAGVCGVSTIHHGLTWVSFVDLHVPYGHIFTFPSQQAYDAWIENGCPA